MRPNVGVQGGRASRDTLNKKSLMKDTQSGLTSNEWFGILASVILR